MSPNKWQWFNTPGQQWRRKQLRPRCNSPPTHTPLRSTAAKQKGRQGKVGQADLCAWHVKRSEWVKRTGHVRVLLLTDGKEEAPCAHGQGPKGANSTCWDRHTYTHVPVMTWGRITSNHGRGTLNLGSDMSKSTHLEVHGLLTFTPFPATLCF